MEVTQESFDLPALYADFLCSSVRIVMGAHDPYTSYESGIQIWWKIWRSMHLQDRGKRCGDCTIPNLQLEHDQVITA
jgi:hypothetical protein